MIAAIFKFFGIHPQVAILAIIVDFILFGGEFFTAGVAIPITVIAGFCVGILAMLGQRGYGDNWVLAFFKGGIIGFLTAWPLPLGSIGTALDGIPGLLALLMGAYPQKSLPDAIQNKPERRRRQLSGARRGHR